MFCYSNSGINKCSLNSIDFINKTTPKTTLFIVKITCKKTNQTKQFDMTNLHGEFYCDQTFGKISFSKDETKVCYVAERKKQENKDFIDDFIQDFGGFLY